MVNGHITGKRDREPPKEVIKSDALLPRFVQFDVLTMVDHLTGKDLIVIHALDDRGWLWRKMGFKPWENITGREFFEMHEQSMPEAQ